MSIAPHHPQSGPPRFVPTNQQPPYPGHQAPPGPPPSTETKQATWALVLAFIPAGLTLIAASVMAIKTLNRIQRREQVGGRKRAIAALVVVGCWVMGFIAAFALADPADRDTGGAISDAGTLSVVDVKEGDCINVPTDGEVVRSVEATPCSTPHEWEAYSSFDLPGGAYPGDGVVKRSSYAGCVDAARDFLGATPEKAGVTVAPLFPLKESWGAGAREVTCLVGYDNGGRTTGTLADVGKDDFSGGPDNDTDATDDGEVRT